MKAKKKKPRLSSKTGPGQGGMKKKAASASIKHRIKDGRGLGRVLPVHISQQKTNKRWGKGNTNRKKKTEIVKYTK